MFSKVQIARDSDSTNEFVAGIKAVCDHVASPYNQAQHGAYGDMLVRYSSWGISCQFGQRLFQLPKEFNGLSVTHVSMDIPYSKSGTPGVYKRKRATAVVELKEHDEPKRSYVSIIIDAENLRSANRLLDDILTGVAQPTKKYGE